MELRDMKESELWELAKKFDLDLPKNTKRPQLENEIEKAHIKRKARLQAEAQAELALEAQKKLGLDPKKKFKPSPETIAIEKSKRKYYLFHNNEEEGVKVAFRKGPKHRFELFDGKIHVLPEWLVQNLRKTAIYPQYEFRKNPVTGLEESVHVGNRPRFGFDELGDAPQDADFGVVVDKEIEAQFLQITA